VVRLVPGLGRFELFDHPRSEAKLERVAAWIRERCDPALEPQQPLVVAVERIRAGRRPRGRST
jgi:hypothetical protein